jgi:hypothetical protein
MQPKSLLAAVVLLMAIAAFAQDSSGASAAASAQYQNPEVTRSSSSQTVIRGCLSGSSGNYTLTDQNGMQYQVSGDDATLRSMVGREVEISGLENSAGEAGTQGDETSNRATNGLQASGVRAVSSTCHQKSSVTAPPTPDNNGVSPRGTPDPPRPQL